MMNKRIVFLLILALVSLLAACGDQQTQVHPGNSVLQPAAEAESTVELSSANTTNTPTTNTTENTQAIPQTLVVDEAAIDTESGKHLFAEVCAPCHGQEATGIDGIDINLTRSKFVGGASVEQLAIFLIRGLGINNPFNVTEIRMPPRGGRDDLTNQDMIDIATYLKSINTQELGEERVSAYFEWLESAEAEEIEANQEVGQEGLTGAALDGQTTYLRFCAVCHGPNAEGVETLGKGFRDSEFVADLSDEELVEFLSIGRPDDHPLNETGIEMLPFGGQPYLTEEQLDNLVAYIRAVNTGESVPPRPVDIQAEVRNGGEEEEALAIMENVTPRCFSCHVIGNDGNVNGPGPNLNGLKERAADQVKGLDAEEYVHQSIVDPGAFMVAECPRGPCVDVMSKNYAEKLSEEEIATIVDFLLTLPAEE